MLTPNFLTAGSADDPERALDQLASLIRGGRRQCVQAIEARESILEELRIAKDRAAHDCALFDGERAAAARERRSRLDSKIQAAQSDIETLQQRVATLDAYLQAIDDIQATVSTAEAGRLPADCVRLLADLGEEFPGPATETVPSRDDVDLEFWLHVVDDLAYKTPGVTPPSQTASPAGTAVAPPIGSLDTDPTATDGTPDPSDPQTDGQLHNASTDDQSN